MTDEMKMNQQGSRKRGPRAPKNPAVQRSSLYVVIDTTIEATARRGRKPSQEIYLDLERLMHRTKLTSGISDENILQLLKSCNGFHQLVHSMGVSVKAKDGDTGVVDFILQNYAKENPYATGTRIKVPCPKDGTEVVFKLEDYRWSAEDDVVGRFVFEFDHPGEMAVATVKLYLNDGYEVAKITNETPVAFGSQEYKSMISRSLFSRGNNRRLKTAIEKAKRGEDITIAYIGGSLTQGAAAKPINIGCYAYQSYMSFKEKFGKDGGGNIHFIKAGVGGTPSELGMIRYDRDILRNGAVKPDIVIVEFAVNDEGDETEGVCFESLCKKILLAENKPAVVLLFSVFLDDWNLQERLAPIGYHYHLPMVSVKDAVQEQFQQTKENGNIISKRQFFFDIYHPTNEGHKVMSDSLMYLFSQINQSDMDREDNTTDQKPLLGDLFVDIRLLDRKNPDGTILIQEGGFTAIDQELQRVEMDADPFPTDQFPHNWMHTASSGNESFRMSVKSRYLVLVYKDSDSNSFGKADVLVDGRFFKTLSPHENNWTHCNPVILFQEGICGEHTIEIKMSSGDEDKCFTILGFGLQ